jgi:hypothetical protein
MAYDVTFARLRQAVPAQHEMHALAIVCFIASFFAFGIAGASSMDSSLVSVDEQHDLLRELWALLVTNGA